MTSGANADGRFIQGDVPRYAGGAAPDHLALECPDYGQMSKKGVLHVRI